MSDKAQDRAAAQLRICPVCKRGPVDVKERPDGGEEGLCLNHKPYLWLERDSEDEPLRVMETQPPNPPDENQPHGAP
jgi:hypothetical protein